MTEVFYKGDPQWFFSNDELVKTQSPPEWYRLDLRDVNEFGIQTHRVVENHCVDGEIITTRTISFDRKEAIGIYRRKRMRIISSGFDFVLSPDKP